MLAFLLVDRGKRTLCWRTQTSAPDWSGADPQFCHMLIMSHEKKKASVGGNCKIKKPSVTHGKYSVGMMSPPFFFFIILFSCGNYMYIQLVTTEEDSKLTKLWTVQRLRPLHGQSKDGPPWWLWVESGTEMCAIRHRCRTKSSSVSPGPRKFPATWPKMRPTEFWL